MLTGQALKSRLTELIATPADNNEHLQRIYDLTVAANAQRVVELGVGHGRTTTALLAALEETGGHLWSCDVLDFPGTRAAFDPNRWAYIVAPSLVWGRAWTGDIDVLFIDSSHARDETEAELRLFGPWVRPAGQIIMHDTVSHPAVLEAIYAWLDPLFWDLELHAHNNGLAVLTRKVQPPSTGRKVCRLPFAPPDYLNSTSGPSVLLAAITEAVAGDPRFADTAHPGAADDLLWYPIYMHRPQVGAAVRAGRRLAIGPNVLFGNSAAPGAGDWERGVCAYTNFQAVFTLSRWYSELTRRAMAQQDCHYLLDFPLPATWAALRAGGPVLRDAFVYIKQASPVESAIAHEITAAFPGALVLGYGGYKRDDLLEAARSSRACFFISRDDHYPLSAVEISLMGCPIIADEKSCPPLIHRVTGIQAPVRERLEGTPAAWAADAAKRMIAEFPGALAMDRNAIREATLDRHDPAVAVTRMAAALGLDPL